MHIIWLRMLPIPVPWDWKKHGTIINGKPVDSIFIHKPIGFVKYANISAVNDND